MAASRKTTPRRLMQREAHREQILTAALKAFSRSGYHGTHVADVIAEAGIARGTFYFHFQSKHDVFAALVDRTLAILLAVRPVEEEPPVRRRADAEAILHASYTLVLETIHEHRRLMRLLFDEALGIGKGFRKQLEQHFSVWRERITATLRYFQEHGVGCEDLDIEVTGEFALGMVERLARRYLFGSRNPDIPRLVDVLVAFDLRGIAGR